MDDSTKLSTLKKEFPAQAKNRRQWCLDAVRANQADVTDILRSMVQDDGGYAIVVFNGLHKADRDALTIEDGIFTPEQIAVLIGE